MLNLLQTWLAKIPHLLYFLGVAFVGGLASYLAEVPASSLLTAFSTQEGATALLKGALIAGLLAVISVLKPATKGEIKSVNEVRAAAKITVPPVLGVMLFVVLLSSFMVGCIADAPIVPVTAATSLGWRPKNLAAISASRRRGLRSAMTGTGNFAFAAATGSIKSAAAPFSSACAMKLVTLHDLNNPSQEIGLDADDFSLVAPFGSGSSVRVKSSDQPIAVHEAPERVLEIVREAEGA